MQLEEIKNLLQEKKMDNFSEIFNTGHFTEKYKLDLPFKVLQDFQNFDRKLNSDPKFQEDTVNFHFVNLIIKFLLISMFTNIAT